MLTRKAMKRLKEWKQNKTRQALLVTGARQVGKTYLIREFAKSNYKRLAEFNLIEDTSVRDSFNAAKSADDLALRISVAADTQLLPAETLIFIDEVQEAPEVVTFIKFLVEKGDFDYILSGSLLGVELENIRSIPIGYLSTIKLYPLDFEEFCWASGLTDDVFALAKSAFITKTPIADYLHNRLLDLFHRYLLIGGMPDEKVAFQETDSIDQVRVIQDNIIDFYEYDISKYAPKNRRLVIKDIFSLIPSELSSQNRRFRLSSIKDVRRYGQVEEEFLWLTRANVALATYNVKLPASPLVLNESHSLFKLFLSDVGLLASRFPKQAALGLLDCKPSINMGGIYENFVAQELVAHGFVLRYYSGKKVGELDFVIERKDGTVIALEVKSGSSYKTHAALSNALRAPGFGIDEAYVLAETTASTNADISYLPIYLAGMFENA
jgi:predicted AAA+ superfamily ATPase